MNAKRLSVEAIKEGIAKQMFHITGVTEQGEVVIALLSNIEKEVIEKGGEPLRKYLEYFPDNTEIKEIYLGNASTSKRCLRNNLLIKI